MKLILQILTFQLIGENYNKDLPIQLRECKNSQNYKSNFRVNLT